MKTENYIKWLLFAFLSLFLVACKPTAKFNYSPTAPTAGEVVKFDASTSSVYKAKEGNAISVYAWNFGDGSQGNGVTAEHTYKAAGQYTVTLSVTDLAGQTNTTTQKITVKTATVINKDVSVTIQSADGASIPGATVTIQGQTAQTDINGLANLKLTLPQGTQQVVAKFEKAGFVTQSVVYDGATLKSISARLLAIKQSVPVHDIAQAQVIESQHLGANITIPAQAFVKADGSAATGAVTVEFTPWDITASDLNAMPANGVARDAQGNIINLISAGMITATFKDAAGQELQLAQGKTANIQMHLPLKSINNQEMKVGTQIPMWHFDESKGLWIEEGAGQVVASTSSSTGLDVQATVSHFSTWNWDFKFANAGSVFVQCQQGGVGVPCNVLAKVTLDDGSALTKGNDLPAEGTTVINMPSSGSIQWIGKDATGTMIGEKTSGTSGNVIIELSPPATDNFIQCKLPDGTAVACSGTLNNTLNFNVSKEGGRMITGIKDPDGQLDWSAQTAFIFESNEWVRYRGNLVSSVKGNVTIQLTERKVVQANDVVTFPVVCTSMINGSPTVDANGNWEIDSALVGKPCTVVFETMNADNQYVSLSFDTVYGQPKIIAVPSELFNGPGHGDFSRTLAGTINIGNQDYEGREWLDTLALPGSNKIIPIFLQENRPQ